MQTMNFTANAWSVEWREDRRWKARSCMLATECGGKLTRGAALFQRDGKQQTVAGGAPVCCKACAVAHVVREGLKGAISFRMIAGEMTF